MEKRAVDIKNTHYNSVVDKEPAKMMITIPEFYRDKDVFVTGATGLIGKVLIEKLLRSCPDVRRVFVLLREKKSKDIEQRLDEMKNIPVRIQ